MEIVAREIGRTVRYALGSGERTAHLIALMVIVVIAYSVMF